MKPYFQVPLRLYCMILMHYLYTVRIISLQRGGRFSPSSLHATRFRYNLLNLRNFRSYASNIIRPYFTCSSNPIQFFSQRAHGATNFSTMYTIAYCSFQSLNTSVIAVLTNGWTTGVRFLTESWKPPLPQSRNWDHPVSYPMGKVRSSQIGNAAGA